MNNFLRTVLYSITVQLSELQFFFISSGHVFNFLDQVRGQIPIHICYFQISILSGVNKDSILIHTKLLHRISLPVRMNTKNRWTWLYTRCCFLKACKIKDTLILKNFRNKVKSYVVVGLWGCRCSDFFLRYRTVGIINRAMWIIHVWLWYYVSGSLQIGNISTQTKDLRTEKKNRLCLVYISSLRVVVENEGPSGLIA